MLSLRQCVYCFLNEKWGGGTWTVWHTHVENRSIRTCTNNHEVRGKNCVAKERPVRREMQQSTRLKRDSRIYFYIFAVPICTRKTKVVADQQQKKSFKRYNQKQNKKIKKPPRVLFFRLSLRLFNSSFI